MLSQKESYLVLTIGIGTVTRGNQSDIAAGLSQTIRMCAPVKFWLIPSINEESCLIADLVREDCGADYGFQQWEPSTHYLCIDQPDDLFHCRERISQVLYRVRLEAGKSAEVIINPTSGTKQMSVAAALAAVDMGVGKIEFTTGKREGGLVVSGSEELSSFDAQRFIEERTCREARRLLTAGALEGAVRLLEPLSGDFPGVQEQAKLLARWQAGDYESARQIAAASSYKPVVSARAYLDALARSKPTDESCLSEKIAAAKRALDWGMAEDAFIRFYQVVETLAHARLRTEHGLSEPYTLEQIRGLPGLSSTLFQRLKSGSYDGRSVFLTLFLAYELMASLADPCGESFFENPHMLRLLKRRNEYIHQGATVSLEEAQSLANEVLGFSKIAVAKAPITLAVNAWRKAFEALHA